MMTPRRKLLGLVPFAAAWLLSDKNVHDFLVMMVGGLVIWIPYWIAWWLSDGFIIFSGPSIGYSSGLRRFGHEQRNAHDPEYGVGYDHNADVGYRLGSEGYGFYESGHRIY